MAGHVRPPACDPIQEDRMTEKTPGGVANASPKTITESRRAGLIRELMLPPGWSVLLIDIINQPQKRLDAEHYDPRVVENARKLQGLKCEMVPLSALADVRLPGRFARIWAKDRAHGVPYLNATDLMSYFATGQMAQARFLSRATRTNIDSLLLRAGMILVTCSGTIGRVFEVPGALDGYAGTHDLVRITPKSASMSGFLRAWLATDMAQTQILSHTHGGQIDHVTAEQIGACLVPALSAEDLKRASDLADEADRLRARGLEAMRQVAEFLSKVVSVEK